MARLRGIRDLLRPAFRRGHGYAAVTLGRAAIIYLSSALMHRTRERLAHPEILAQLRTEYVAKVTEAEAAIRE